MRMRVAAAAVLVSSLVVPFTASPAEAAAPVRFKVVQYDSPGSDSGTNKSLNAEWAVVKNYGKKTRNLSGWKIRDNAGHVYRFPKGFKLKPGRTVTLHTGKGTNTARHRYWKKDWYVWNNTGDRATLKNRAGNVVDRCKWGDGDGKVAC